jgi:DNA-binding MarR family transcriptional regulator
MIHPSKNLDILLEHITSLLTSKYDLILTNELGVSYAQYKILVQFKGDQIIKQKTLAGSLGQSEASISRQIKIMSNGGLIHRSFESKNKKSVVITLTREGKVTKTKAEAITDTQNTNSLHRVSSKERKLLTKNLSQIHDQICANNRNH